VTDLINLSRNKAMAAALLMTGDEDIRVGVQQAQEYGVRVHLVGIAASPGGEGNQAGLLKQEADAVCDLSKDEVETFLACRTTPESPEAEGTPTGTQPLQPASAVAPAVLLSQEQLTAIVDATISQMTEDAIQQVGNAGRYSIPAHIDGLLLTTATKALGGLRVPDGSKGKLRGHFFEACERRAKGPR
jgi:hypothetical protein